MRALRAIVKRDLLNFFTNKLRLTLSIFMPFVFIIIFSFMLDGMALDALGVSPITYLIPGVIAIQIYMNAFTNTNSIIEDTKSGFLKEILVAPVSRTSIALGKITAAAIIALFTTTIMLLIGVFLGLEMGIINFVLFLFSMIVFAFAFAGIGLFLASKTSDSTGFQTITSFLMIPIMFLSGAYIPLSSLPNWILPVAYINPMTYAVDLFRRLAIDYSKIPEEILIENNVVLNINGIIIPLWFEFIVIAIIGIVFLYLSVYSFRKINTTKVKKANMGH